MKSIIRGKVRKKTLLFAIKIKAYDWSHVRYCSLDNGKKDNANHTDGKTCWQLNFNSILQHTPTKYNKIFIQNGDSWGASIIMWSDPIIKIVGNQKAYSFMICIILDNIKILVKKNYDVTLMMDDTHHQYFHYELCVI